jgi:hypothetical protein
MKKQVTNQLKIADKIYAPGLHDFSDEVMAHEHFKFYVKAGWIHSPAEAKKIEMSDGQKALALEMEKKYAIPRPLKKEEPKAQAKKK